MLTELSVVEQRYLAVREALDGARITDVATRYGRRSSDGPPLAGSLRHGDAVERFNRTSSARTAMK